RSGSSQRIAAPGEPDCFPRFRFFPSARSAARCCFRGGFRPGRSSDEGGIEEFPLFRDPARTAAANCSRRSATTASSAAICCACSRISASRGSSGGTTLTGSNHPGHHAQPLRQHPARSQNVTSDHSPQPQAQGPECLPYEASVEPLTITPKGRETRDRIVATAARLMAEGGVAGTTVGQIDVAANASGSQLYHYFADKRALVRGPLRTIFQ